MKIILVVLFIVVGIGCKETVKTPKKKSLIFVRDSTHIPIWMQENTTTITSVMIDAIYIDSLYHYSILKNTKVKGFDNAIYYRLVIGDKYLYIDADSNVVITDSAKTIDILLHHVLKKIQDDYDKNNPKNP